MMLKGFSGGERQREPQPNMEKPFAPRNDARDASKIGSVVAGIPFPSNLIFPLQAPVWELND